MKTTIFCKPTDKGIHTFYLSFDNREYFLFSQNYRRGVQEYFGGGVSIENAMDYAKAHKDTAVMRSMSKIPMYIKYVEREYGIEVFEQTKKRNSRNYKYRKLHCA